MKRDELKSLLVEQLEQFRDKDLGIERDKLQYIKNYARTPHVIVISGLRRVGKSTLLSQVAHKLYNKNEYYFVNFEDERFLNFTSNDFNMLYELLIELFGERRVFLFDEIQNILGWERFVRRMTDGGYKFYITGSNALLLSGELGTKLTGRYIPIDLFPFSFGEFLNFKNFSPFNIKMLTTIQRGKLKKAFNEYLQKGGIPDALKYPEITWHKTLYDDVIYRDVATRYQIADVRALKELAFYIMSNISSLMSFNNLKELLKLGSVNTVKSYVDYLETSWLFFVINRYAFSLKKQQIANKKAYCVDTGLAQSIAFSFSANKGKLLENLVFITLRRESEDIYYYKTKKDHEVDFYLPNKRIFMQVCQSLNDHSVRQREILGLTEAFSEIKANSMMILTEDEKETITIEGGKIEVMPIYEWLLSKANLS